MNYSIQKTTARLIKGKAFRIALLALLFQVHFAFGQQGDKVQQTINSIKQTYYCEDQDYHTDGQRVVWVKSYKRWEPSDLAVMKREAPGMFRFLSMVAERSRYDVLQQLLPNYYYEHGGAKAFAADIKKEQGTVSANAPQVKS